MDLPRVGVEAIFSCVVGESVDPIICLTCICGLLYVWVACITGLVSIFVDILVLVIVWVSIFI